MPRNGSGTYVLPENPFVPNTVISSAAVNSDFSDIATALTGSLARTGEGGMLAVLPMAPAGFSYAIDANTGMSRSASDTQVITAGGTDVVEISTAGVDITGVLTATSINNVTVTSGGITIVAGVLTLPIGSVALPSAIFTGDPDTGIYQIGANNIGVAANGAKVLDIGTAGLSVTGNVTVSNGLTVSAGAVSVPAGSIPVASVSGVSMILLNTLTASNSASLSDTTSLTSTYSAYEIILTNVIPATNEDGFKMLLQSGGSFKTTGYIANFNNFPLGVSSDATTYIPLNQVGGTVNNAANAAPGYSGVIRIFNPSASSIIMVGGDIFYIRQGGSAVSGHVNGVWNTSGAVTGVQFQFIAGNITSGTIKIYGIL